MYVPGILRFVVCPSNCHVVIILCDVGGGLHWRDTRAAALAAASRETTAVDQTLLQAYRPARGRRAVRSCVSVIPVSLCTGEAFRPREWSSWSPLAFCPNVFPSVEPTTIVNVCIQFAGFEQNWHFEEMYCIDKRKFNKYEVPVRKSTAVRVDCC